MLGLLRIPRMRAKAIISVLPEVIKDEAIKDGLRMVEYTHLRYICENTARAVGGKYLPVEYKEIVEPKPIDKRTPEQIVDDTISKAGLTII